MKKENSHTWNKLKKGITLIVSVVAFIATVIAIIQYYDKTQIIYVSGKWKLDLVINSTSYDSYKGMNVEYIIYLQQDVKKLEGRGEKWAVNGELLPIKQHTIITFDGNINKDTIKLLFELHGIKRKTVGTFNLESTPDKNIYEGTFNTTGANSSGIVSMERVFE